MTTTATGQTQSDTTDEQSSGAGPILQPTRAQLCGEIIARHSLKAGITNQMLAEAQRLCGTLTERETVTALRDAWDAIEAYVADQQE